MSTDRLTGTLLLVAGLAWVISGDQMAGMDAGPGTDPGTLGFFLSLWVAMTVAMMLPSIVPMVVTYARLQEGGQARGHAAPTGPATLFTAGYLVAWTAAGLLGYAIFELGRSTTGDLFSWDSWGRYLVGAILVGGALYQLTRLKDACLRHCRNPFTFPARDLRSGPAGALRAGVVRGGWCIGCCWALMASLFALGVMSLGWMAFIAALIALDKLLPWKELATRGIALMLVGLGLMVALAPGAVPGLTVPGSPAPMPGMEERPAMEASPGM
jgi:predicted metal-binding membrane protein